jgi:serine phosphatase RsbU (regulator of sigma subunit)
MKVKNIFSQVFLLITVLLVLILPCHVLGQQPLQISTDNLQNNNTVDLGSVGWKYQAGDDPNWANPQFDDSNWETLNSTIFQAEKLPPGGWNGIGWFRLLVNVDENVLKENISLRLQHFGASEIYLDGKLIQKFGLIGDVADVEMNPRFAPIPLTFRNTGDHLIAIRYSSKTSADLSKGLGKWLAKGRYLPGFSSFLQTSSAAIDAYAFTASSLSHYQPFIGVLCALAFLHLLIFIFYRRERANLFYSFFAFSMGIGTAFLSLNNTNRNGALFTAITFLLFVIFYCGSFLALLTFLYVAFAKKFSRIYWLLAIYLVCLMVLMVIYSRATFTLYVVIVFMLLAVIDALRIMFVALRQKREGAWIIMTGVLIFTVGVLLLLAPELQLVKSSRILDLVRSIGLYLGLPVAVSIYLARQFAHTNHDLAVQLDNVQNLSARQLEQERRENELRVEHERTRAENDRRAKELEEARLLQLSMLPKKLPQILNLEIAVYMKPATEVGGDYYDFHVATDGTLTVAVGDATGHGLKAGSVVTATKSLFHAFAGEKDITQVFRQSSQVLKAMNLRGLFMAMTMLKINDNQVQISSAGMPATLIYRDATKQVEKIFIKAMPLGSIVKFPYEQRQISLSPDDCLVIMSDGFPEMFNSQNEMLGFDKAGEVLPSIADKSPEEIINYLVHIGETWAGTRPPDDDVTFVVLKVRNRSLN